MRHTYTVTCPSLPGWSPLVTAYDANDAIRESMREMPRGLFDAFFEGQGRLPDLDRDFVVWLRVPIGVTPDTWPRCGNRWKQVR